MQRQRADFEREYGDSSDLIQKVFNFSLEDLPQQHRQYSSLKTGVANQSVTFEIAGGYTITMTEMVQFSSQSAVLEGFVHPLSSFGDAIGRAQKAFPYFGGTPVGLPPTLQCSQDTNSEGDTWIAAPPICTVAMFESMKSAKDDSADSSSAVLIWFQDGFGIALDDRTRHLIQALDWSAIAEDGWF